MISHLLYLVGNIVSVWLQQRLFLKVLLVSTDDRWTFDSDCLSSNFGSITISASREGLGGGGERWRRSEDRQM